jgi:hypothetical protein
VIQEQYGMNTTIKKDATNYLTEKLTFKSGTGDAPDDWYVYADKKTNLRKKQPISLRSKPVRKKQRKSCKYKDKTLTPIATKWIFWAWEDGKGLTDEIGHATLTDIKFVKADSDYFVPGADFKTK